MHEAVVELKAAPETLPAELRARVVALGKKAVPDLLAVVAEAGEREGEGVAKTTAQRHALAILGELFDGDALRGEALLEVADALEANGVQLTREQWQRRQDERTRKWGGIVPTRAEERPGRNDPCHCGSGKKYKKCHLERDERGSGGGRRAAAAEAEPPFTKAALEQVLAMLLDEAAVGGEREARAAFFGGGGERMLPAWGERLFVGYVLFGRRDGDGRRFVDRFAERRASGLTRQQRAVVPALRQVHASLFEISAIGRTGVRELHDVAKKGAEPFDLDDEQQMVRLKRGELLFAWIVDVGGRRQLLGEFVRVPEYAKTAVLAAVRTGEGDDRGATVPAVWQALAEAIRAQPKVKKKGRKSDEELMAEGLDDEDDESFDDDGDGDADGGEDDGDEDDDELVALDHAHHDHAHHDHAHHDHGYDDDELAYDAARAPDVLRWNLAEELEQLAAVEEFHRLLDVHPPVPSGHLHALQHAVVETHAVESGPNPTRATLERLMRAGLSRHEAVHAVAAVMADGFWARLRLRRLFATDALHAALATLGPGPHAGTAPK